MADDITLPIPGGTTIAADEISGKKHQRVKISHGTDGSAVDTSSTDPLPVTIAGGAASTTLGTGSGIGLNSDAEFGGPGGQTVLYVQPLDESGRPIMGDSVDYRSGPWTTAVDQNFTNGGTFGIDSPSYGPQKQPLVTGYSLYSYFGASSPGEYWTYEFIGVSGSTVVRASGLLHGEDHASYSGSRTAPVCAINPSEQIKLRLTRVSGSATTVHVYGHVAWVWAS